MPALITHDFFGRDVYDRQFNFIGGSRDEADAFLLGNQGPDPLFFARISPRFHNYTRIGSVMHDRKPSELIAALKQSLSILPEEDREIGRAYALGFVCHYTLDATVHPFVFAQQHAICDAGEPGLDRSSGSEVHAVIESEFDELVLFAKREETVATFNPAQRVLKATDHTLAVISKIYAYLALSVYGIVIPEDLFAASVKNYRRAQWALHSPRGVKRSAIGAAERLVRLHSMAQALTPRAIERTESDFDNRSRAPWTNPFTFDEQNDSFWDLYAAALDKALEHTEAFDRASFDIEDARAMTHDCDFSGAPVVAVLTAVEDVPAQTSSDNA